jgi:hypothetical protein
MMPVFPEFGDHVQVVSLPETVALGYADREGTVYGFTTPSVTNVEVIGGLEANTAFNIHFEGDAAEDAWFAPHLIRFLDHAPGTVIRIGDNEMIRGTHGSWSPKEGDQTRLGIEGGLHGHRDN